MDTSTLAQVLQDPSSPAIIFEPGDDPTTVGVIPTGQLFGSKERAVGHASFDLDVTRVQSLGFIPTTANSAIIILEAAEGSTAGAVLSRFWQDGFFPTATDGLPVKDGSVIEIQGQYNVQNTRIISTDGRAHRLQVQYFN